MTALLEIQKVTKIFGSGFLHRHSATVAVDEVSLTISEDQPSIMALAGESGSGKTTLSLLMMGQIEPTKGSVLYRGKDLGKMNRQEHKQLRREVQPIYQDPFAAFNPFYRVDHVLRIPLKRFKMTGSESEATQMIHQALEMVGLRPAETLGRFPHQLSGGQRQRLMVARAMLCRPKMIMADEPVSMVDASLRATILASLKNLNREFGIPIIYITHDLTTAYQICDNIVVLYSGSVVEAGSTEQVIRNPKHPYTQLLISSIPLPDRKKRWLSRSGGNGAGLQPSTSAACKFVSRCPAAMPRCQTERPPLYRPDSSQVVACFLYRDHPVLESADVAEAFSAPER